MKASGPPTSDRAPSHPPAPRAASPAAGGVPAGRTVSGTAGLRVSAQRLGPSSPRRLVGGEVAPSLHRCSSLPYRIRLDPRPGALLCREAESLPCSCLCFCPRRLRVSGAASRQGDLRAPRAAIARCAGWEAPVPGTAWMRGHPPLQLHNLPPKPSLEEAAGGLGGLKGSVAFPVIGKTFFSPFTLLSLSPAAGQSRGDASPQLPVQGTRCNFPF